MEDDEKNTRKKRSYEYFHVFNPFRAPEPLPVLNPSIFVPKNGFPVVKGLMWDGSPATGRFLSSDWGVEAHRVEVLWRHHTRRLATKVTCVPHPRIQDTR